MSKTVEDLDKAIKQIPDKQLKEICVWYEPIEKGIREENLDTSVDAAIASFKGRSRKRWIPF